MKSEKTVNLVLLVIGTLLISAMIASNGFTNPASNSVFAQGGGEKKFTTNLAGKNEVPSKDTNATGTAEFTLSSDGKTITYKVDVKGIDKVTMAHIHQGKLGENGPVAVVLFKVCNTYRPREWSIGSRQYNI